MCHYLWHVSVLSKTFACMFIYSLYHGADESGPYQSDSLLSRQGNAILSSCLSLEAWRKHRKWRQVPPTSSSSSTNLLLESVISWTLCANTSPIIAPAKYFHINQGQNRAWLSQSWWRITKPILSLPNQNCQVMDFTLNIMDMRTQHEAGRDYWFSILGKHFIN